MGGKPARLATPTGPGEGRVLRMPVGFRRGRLFALRLFECRQFGEGEAEVLCRHLDIFAGLCLLPHFEGGDGLGHGLLQIPQIAELHVRQVEIRHRVLRLIQRVWRTRAEPAWQEIGGAGGLGGRGDPLFRFPGSFPLVLTMPDEIDLSLSAWVSPPVIRLRHLPFDGQSPKPVRFPARNPNSCPGRVALCQGCPRHPGLSGVSGWSRAQPCGRLPTGF